jgi:hypothetical protein
MRLLVLAIAVACSAPRPRVQSDGPTTPDAAIDAPSDATPAPPDPLAALAAMPGTCTSDGWCWRFPTPTGNRYFGVFATSPDNIWVTGARGTVYQWAGAQWIIHHPPTLPGQDVVAWPWAIHGRAKNDMWLIMMSAVEHWDGANWTILDTGPTNVAPYFGGVWEAPNGDVWTVSNDYVKRSQGGGPFQVIKKMTNLTAVWGIAADDLFVSGPGQILHWDGQELTQVYQQPAGITKVPTDFMGFKDDVWVSGGYGTLLHWDGHAWTPVPSGLPSTVTIFPVAAPASNDVWWWTQASSFSQSFVHWDGTSINIYPIDVASYGDSCCPELMAMSIIDGRWWILAVDGAIYTKDGATTIRPIIKPWYTGGYRLWGTGDDDMYFQAGNAIAHWDGTQMTNLPYPAASGTLNGLAHTGVGGANELFSLGNDIDFTTYEDVYSGLHYDGQAWAKTELLRSPAPFGARLTNSYAIGPGEALIVGQNGVAFRYHDGVWTPVATGTTNNLQAMWGPDADHVWISGAAGTLLQWNRTNPDVMTPDPTFPATTNDLGPIHGAGGIMWVVNLNTFFVSMLQNGTWTQVNTGLIAYDVFALGRENVLVTSSTSDDYVARWQGSDFVLEDHNYEGPLRAVFAPPNGHTWLTNGRTVSWHQ